MCLHTRLYTCPYTWLSTGVIERQLQDYDVDFVVDTDVRYLGSVRDETYAAVVSRLDRRHLRAALHIRCAGGFLHGGLQHARV